MNYFKLIKEMEANYRAHSFYQHKAGVWGYQNLHTHINHSSKKKGKRK